jgi:hypothetical protein
MPGVLFVRLEQCLQRCGQRHMPCFPRLEVVVRLMLLLLSGERKLFSVVASGTVFVRAGIRLLRQAKCDVREKERAEACDPYRFGQYAKEGDKCLVATCPRC